MSRWEKRVRIRGFYIAGCTAVILSWKPWAGRPGPELGERTAVVRETRAAFCRMSSGNTLRFGAYLLATCPKLP